MDCAKVIYRKEGIRGIYKGLWATVLRETPSYGGYFLCYELLHEQFGDSNLALFTAGGLAGVAAVSNHNLFLNNNLWFQCLIFCHSFYCT